MTDPRRETESEDFPPAEPLPARPPEKGDRDRVEKESKESFPASDAPSFTPGKLS